MYRYHFVSLMIVSVRLNTNEHNPNTIMTYGTHLAVTVA